MRNIIEHFALFLLRIVGTEIMVVPTRMNKYHSEIMEFVKEEETKNYNSTDMHGDGYFKTRIVWAKMLKLHPGLVNDRRALLKAIIRCSDLISSGNSQ